MVNNVTDFGKIEGDQILSDNVSPDTDDDILTKLSFLRTLDLFLKDPTYHLFHLTYQEYFAASYFVRQWNEGKRIEFLLPNMTKPNSRPCTEFLAENKYDDRYDIFWRFVAGLLDPEEEKTAKFFEKMETVARDQLGPTHQRLVMHCFSEIQAAECSAVSRLRKKWEGELWNLLMLELNLMGTSELACDRDIPTDVLLKFFGMATKSAKRHILKAFGGQASLSEPVLQAVVAQLEHDDSDVRSAAVEALGGPAAKMSLCETA